MMFIKIKMCVCLMVIVGIAQFVRADSERFAILIVSDVRGSLGRSKIVYSGEILIESHSFTLSVTNVVKSLPVNPMAAVDMQPFVCTVNFEDDFNVVKMAVLLTHKGDDKRALNSAYLLSYLVCENMIYPFLGEGILKKLQVDNETGQVVFVPKAPKTVVFGPLGSMAGSETKVGPVRPSSFVLIPEKEESHSRACLGIGWWNFNEVQYEWHVRKLYEGETFPRILSILSASPVEECGLDPIDVVMATARLTVPNTIESYNRYDIQLTPEVNAKTVRLLE